MKRRTIIATVTLTLGATAVMVGALQPTAPQDRPDDVPDDRAAAPSVIVDIRMPAEWQATGVIEGALLLPGPDPRNGAAVARFADTLMRALGDGPGGTARDVVLICRTQNRSVALQRALAGRGVTVGEQQGGMAGVVAGGGPTVAPTAPTLGKGRDPCEEAWSCTDAGAQVSCGPGPRAGG